MRITNTLKNAYKEIGYSIRRFPLTVLFLVAFAFINARMIEEVSEDYTRLLFTVLMGATLSAVGQLIYERFYHSKTARFALMGSSLGLTTAYYFILGMQEEVEMSLYIRTVVALFALFIAFIWVPTINNDRVAFHQSFLSVFKAIVTTLVFTGVLAMGIILIFQAIHFLLFELDDNVLSHLLNLIGSLFVPLYFLSQVPSFMEDYQERHFTVPVVLDRLLSFIIIPLVSIYTLILILYILFNIGENFWTDNLLEPLLVSYTLIGIIVLLLSNNVNNRITTFFQKVFPKIFVPIVIFQTISSILKIGEMGITHGRYYVILFGIFALVAGVLFSINRPKYYGWIAVVLLVLATISFVPPVDAFSVSKRNQIHLFEEKLEEVGLLENNTIFPNGDVPPEDRIMLTKLTTYLSEMGYADEIVYLPDDFEVYNDFSQTFGFEMTYSEDTSSENAGNFAYSENEYNVVHDIQEDDLFTHQYVNFNKGEGSQATEEIPFTVNDLDYTVTREIINDTIALEVIDSEDNTLITVEATGLFMEIFNRAEESAYISIDKNFGNATFIEENDQVKIKLLLIALEDTSDYYSADFYLFVDIK